MIPWRLLATAATPDGAGLRLLRRGDEFSIRLAGGNELMNSRLGGSEAALATLALASLGDRDAASVLIGGLGMGFTLRAAAAIVAEGARLVVAEIVPEVVDWAGGAMAPVFGASLSDPRVTVLCDDVGRVIRQAEAGAFDAVLLDVDNGPDGLSRPGNDALYGAEGLRAARRALAPGGVLAVWSAHPDRGFERRLAAAGFGVETRTARAGGGRRGARHTVWLARRPRGDGR